MNVTNCSIPWVEKYRPLTIDDLVQDSSLISFFKNCIKTTNISHMLFYGPPGTGKTSAILAIGRAMFHDDPSRVIEFNASDDRGINAVREKISKEAKKHIGVNEYKNGLRMPEYKIIICDEADSMTEEAQDALRVIIEKYSSATRFVFICNYIQKITDAIKSRCASIYFKKLSIDCMTNKLNEIITKENMVVKSDIIKTIIEVSNGDMRKAIMMLQNLKYLNNFNQLLLKKISDMTLEELKIVSMIDTKTIHKTSIENGDIYHLAAFINSDQADQIIDTVVKSSNIRDLNLLTHSVIALGYPVNNLIIQLNNAILRNKLLSQLSKAYILKNSSQIVYRVIECANEYIQMLSYFSLIKGVVNKDLLYLT